MAKIKKIAALFFVVLFMSYYANVSLFFHAHIISGATIIHSHIHADSHHNTNSGGHTCSEITLIAHISQFEYNYSSICDIPSPSQFSFHENKVNKATDRITSVHLQNLSLRAPPF